MGIEPESCGTGRVERPQNPPKILPSLGLGWEVGVTEPRSLSSSSSAGTGRCPLCPARGHRGLAGGGGRATRGQLQDAGTAGPSSGSAGQLPVLPVQPDWGCPSAVPRVPPAEGTPGRARVPDPGVASPSPSRRDQPRLWGVRELIPGTRGCGVSWEFSFLGILFPGNSVASFKSWPQSHGPALRRFPGPRSQKYSRILGVLAPLQGLSHSPARRSQSSFPNSGCWIGRVWHRIPRR